MSKYSCKCPAPGCKYKLTVEAGDKKEAVAKFNSQGKIHLNESHPDFPYLEIDAICGYMEKTMKSL